jgi:hypothetical protein
MNYDFNILVQVTILHRFHPTTTQDSFAQKAKWVCTVGSKIVQRFIQQFCFIIELIMINKTINVVFLATVIVNNPACLNQNTLYPGGF